MVPVARSTANAPLRMMRLRSSARLVVAIVALAALGAAAGLVATYRADLAIPLALAVLAVGVAAIDMSLIPVLAVPATIVVVRVGPMSVADLVLGFTSIIALLLLRGRGAKALQPLLLAGACYIALSAPQLLLNRYLGNYIEWAHEIVLVLGSLVVGFVIGREGHARLALGLYVAICWVLAVAAIFTTMTNGFGPVYLGELHKNALGAVLMIGTIIAFANPPWLGWRPWFAYTSFAVFGLGMLAAQSRQAIVGALIGVLVVGLRPRFHNGKRSRLMWLILIPVSYFVVSAVQEQLESGDQFNSANQRLTWYDDSIRVWLQSPLFGVGHRWWITGHTGYAGFQPPNVELEVLTTVGILGLVGFFALFGAAFWILAKMNPAYGTLALAVVVGRFAQAQFDIYWVAGHASILWLIAGICVGVEIRDKARGITRVPAPVQTFFRRTNGYAT